MRTVPPLADPEAIAMFSVIDSEELFFAAMDRPEDAGDDAEPSDAGLLISRSDLLEVSVECKMLQAIAELMKDAGAPAPDIDRVAEDVGEDEVRLVIWIGGTRFWVGAIEFTRASDAPSSPTQAS